MQGSGRQKWMSVVGRMVPIQYDGDTAQLKHYKNILTVRVRSYFLGSRCFLFLDGTTPPSGYGTSTYKVSFRYIEFF